jgi:large subunit ribosomal protein L28
MSRQCEVTGIKSLKGLKRSHALNSCIKHQQPNLHNKRYWLAKENKWVSLKVSAKGMRTINKKGIEAVLREMKAS